MNTTTQTFNVSFPRALVDEIDRVAAAQFGSRSDFLRTAALDYIKQQYEWEYIFGEGQKIGAQGTALDDEAVADAVTRQRRNSGRWFVSPDAS